MDPSGCRCDIVLMLLLGLRCCLLLYLHLLSLLCFLCSVCLVFACTGSRHCSLHDVILYLAEKECMNVFGIPMSMTAMQRPQSHQHLLEEPG